MSDSPGRAAVLVQVARDLEVSADLRILSRGLAHHGVPWAVFKGPVLRHEVYGPNRLRPYADLDVLVHPRDLRRVLALLPTLEAQQIDRDWRLIRSSRRSELSWSLPAGTFLDLHWHVLNHPAQRRRLGFETQRLLDRRRDVGVGGLQVSTFDELDTVLHVAVHGCLAGGHEERWLRDLQLCLHHHRPDRAALQERAEQENAVLPLAVMIERTAQWLDPEVRRWAPVITRGRAWEAALRWWSHRHDPRAWAGGRGSGRGLVEATRDTTGASVRALTASGARRLRYEGARRVGVQLAEMEKGRLTREGGTVEDREAYLSYVEAQRGSR